MVQIIQGWAGVSYSFSEDFFFFAWPQLGRCCSSSYHSSFGVASLLSFRRPNRAPVGLILLLLLQGGLAYWLPFRPTAVYIHTQSIRGQYDRHDQYVGPFGDPIGLLLLLLLLVREGSGEKVTNGYKGWLYFANLRIQGNIQA